MTFPLPTKEGKPTYIQWGIHLQNRINLNLQLKGYVITTKDIGFIKIDFLARIFLISPQNAFNHPTHIRSGSKKL